MRRGWRFKSCGTAMEVEPPRAGMVLTNVAEVVVVVLVPEVDAAVLLPSDGKLDGREVGSRPNLGLKPLWMRVVVVPAWLDVTVVPDDDARPDGVKDTLAPLTS